MIDLRWSFLVVTSGKPSARSKRIWWPNTDSVPVPVRSRFSTPLVRIRSIRSRYWRMGLRGPQGDAGDIGGESGKPQSSARLAFREAGVLRNRASAAFEPEVRSEGAANAC